VTVVRELPNALRDQRLARWPVAHRIALFLDYDGVLTPIVDRTEDAVLSERMRGAVHDLAMRAACSRNSGVYFLRLPDMQTTFP
jgi:trehalose 6-phosphate phosphatase